MTAPKVIVSRKKLAEIVREWRTEGNINRAAAIKLSGLHWVSLYQIENPAWDMADAMKVTKNEAARIEKLAAAMDMTTDTLLQSIVLEQEQGSFTLEASEK